MDDDANLAEQVKRVRRIGYIGMGVALLSLLLLLLTVLSWPLGMSMGVWVVFGIGFIGGAGLEIYALVALKGSARFRSFTKAEQATMAARFERTLEAQPWQFALGALIGVGVASTGYLMIHSLVGFVLLGLAGGEMGSDPSAVQVAPWCVLPLYVLLVAVVPVAASSRAGELKPLFKGRWATIGYAIGVAVVWVPLLLLIAL